MMNSVKTILSGMFKFAGTSYAFEKTRNNHKREQPTPIILTFYITVNGIKTVLYVFKNNWYTTVFRF